MQDRKLSLIPKVKNLEDLIQKAESFVASAKSPATLKAYRNDWRDFESWCRLQNLPSLPSTPETVSLYIADQASTPALATITRRLTSSTKAHQAAGYMDSPSSTRHFIVGETLKGVRRVNGTAQIGKSPLLTKDIRRIIAACPRTMAGLRDKALVRIGFTPKVIWSIVKEGAANCGLANLAPHDLRRTCARLCHHAGGELEQIQFLLGHVSVETTERYLGCKRRFQNAVNDAIGLEPGAS